jgi:outer membrane receptor protein involved in Fe transport
LNLSYRYHRGNNTQHNDIIISDEINYTIPDYRQHSSGILTEHAAQVDYVQPLRRLTTEGGLKGIYRNHESDFDYLSLNETTGQFEEDTTRSNIFTSTQNILAAYSSFSYRAGRWHLKAGLRAEQTMTNIYSDNGAAPLAQKYMNVLPSIIAERKLKGNSSLNFSFSKRIQRPSAEELNPFIDRSNPNFQSGGNPFLLPITSDAYQLSYMISGKATLNISVGHMYFSRVITPFPFYDSSTNITSSRYENFGKCKVYKTNISMRYPITEKWNFTFESDIRYVTCYGIANGINFKNSGPGVYLYASSGYSIDKGWRANADITYKMAGMMLPIGTTNGFVASSFSVNKNIAQTKLTVSAAVNNPFTKYRYVEEEVTSTNFTQTLRNQSYYRRFTLSLNYRFGKLKEETRKDRRGISLDDAAT